MSQVHWGSRLGFILAATGSAIGLGAIWKFPYMVAKNGGGVFLVLFLAMCFTLGLILMVTEMAIGRAGRGSVVGSLRKLGLKRWTCFGYLPIISCFFISSYYSVVGGWSVAYIFKSFSPSFLTDDPSRLHVGFESFIRDPVLPILFLLLFITLCIGVLTFGIERGIERLSKFLMPLFFVLMLLLIVRVLTLPGAIEGVESYLHLDWGNLSIKVILEALGLAFFSLSLGLGIMVTYGSHIQGDTNLPHSAMWVILLATFTCILAGLMIIPATSVFGIEQQAGPGLTFITMPGIFYKMPGGNYFSVMFFILLVVAALTSAVSIYEVVLRFIIEEWGISRSKAVLFYAVAVFVLGAACSLSLGVWENYTLFGLNIFGLLEFASEKVMMPATEVLLALAVGWLVWPRIRDELHLGANIKGVTGGFVASLKSLNQWVAPVLIGWVMLDYLVREVLLK